MSCTDDGPALGNPGLDIKKLSPKTKFGLSEELLCAVCRKDMKDEDDEKLLTSYLGFDPDKRWPKHLYWGPDGHKIHPYYLKNKANFKKKKATWTCLSGCDVKLTCHEEDGKDVYRLSGEHSIKCRNKRGVDPWNVTEKKAGEHIDITEQFKRRLRDVALERLHVRPMDVYKDVNKEFCREYPDGAVRPTSQQVRGEILITIRFCLRLKYRLILDLCLISDSL